MIIGYAWCGSFCTLEESYRAMTVLRRQGHELQPIMSETAFATDTRFGTCRDWREKVEALCAQSILHTIVETEPLGPSRPMDALIIAPCTGNTLAKLANGVTDTPVCMAAKAHLRCDRPLLLAVASNDALSANLSNIAALLKRKHIFFVPLRQDDPRNKPHSLVADFSLIPEALEAAKEGRQLRPLFR